MKMFVCLNITRPEHDLTNFSHLAAESKFQNKSLCSNQDVVKGITRKVQSLVES